MKLEGSSSVSPSSQAETVIRIEGRAEAATSLLHVGQQLDATVVRVLDEGMALLDFGPFSLMARNAADVTEGSRLRLELERLTPNIEFKVLPEPVVPDRESLGRALAALIRDSMPEPMMPPLLTDPTAVDHPDWKASVATLMNVLRLASQAAAPASNGTTPTPESSAVAIADKSAEQAVASAVEQSGIFFEARAMSAAGKLLAAADQISTIVEKFASTTGDLMNLIRQSAAPTVDARSTGVQKNTALKDAAVSEIGKMLELIGQLPKTAPDAVAELLAGAKNIDARIEPLELLLQRLHFLVRPIPLDLPETGTTIRASERLLSVMKEAVQEARQAVTDFMKHSSSDQKAALLQMAALAKDAGKPEVVREVETALRIIEGFQAAGVAERKDAAQPFIMIPLPIIGEEGREIAELKVFCRKKDSGPQFDPDDMTVSLLLRMSSLGRVRADARIMRNTASCEFWTESQSAHQFISHHISDLRSALGSVGFTDVTISASIDRKKIDEYHSFRNTDEGPNRVLDMKI